MNTNPKFKVGKGWVQKWASHEHGWTVFRRADDKYGMGVFTKVGPTFSGRAIDMGKDNISSDTPEGIVDLILSKDRHTICGRCGQALVKLTDGTYDCGCSSIDLDAVSPESEPYPSVENSHD